MRTTFSTGNHPLTDVVRSEQDFRYRNVVRTIKKTHTHTHTRVIVKPSKTLFFFFSYYFYTLSKLLKNQMSSRSNDNPHVFY